MGLDHVRKAMAVIPQTSFIFEGSLRFNIDPMQQVPDSLIVSTLKDFGLYDLLIPKDRAEAVSGEKVPGRVSRLMSARPRTSTDSCEPPSSDRAKTCRWANGN